MRELNQQLHGRPQYGKLYAEVIEGTRGGISEIYRDLTGMSKAVEWIATICWSEPVQNQPDGRIYFIKVWRRA